MTGAIPREPVERLLDLSPGVALSSEVPALLRRRGIGSVAAFVGWALADPEGAAAELKMELEQLEYLVDSTAQVSLSEAERKTLARQAPQVRLSSLEWSAPSTEFGGLAAAASPPPTPTTALPPSINLKPLPPVRHQGRRYTCTAFATIAVFEIRSWASREKIDLSEQYLYWQTKQNDGIDDSASSWLHHAFRVALSGVCLETLFRYTHEYPGYEAEINALPPPAAASADAAQRQLRGRKLVDDPTQVSPVLPIRQSLSEGNAVAVTLKVDSSFHGNTALGLGEPVPLPSGETTYFHSLALVGYEDRGDRLGGGQFRARNSAGEEWAEEGYCWFPYAYLESNTREAWVAA